jgi:hypothetical protein
MRVSEYAKEMGITRQGAYWRLHHGLVQAHTESGHWVIDQDQIDYESMERECDELFIQYFMDANHRQMGGPMTELLRRSGYKDKPNEDQHG